MANTVGDGRTATLEFWSRWRFWVGGGGHVRSPPGRVSEVIYHWSEYMSSDDDCEWVSDLEGPKVGSRSWSWSFLFFTDTRISVYHFFRIWQ